MSSANRTGCADVVAERVAAEVDLESASIETRDFNCVDDPFLPGHVSGLIDLICGVGDLVEDRVFKPEAVWKEAYQFLDGIEAGVLIGFFTVFENSEAPVRISQWAIRTLCKL